MCRVSGSRICYYFLSYVHESRTKSVGSVELTISLKNHQKLDFGFFGFLWRFNPHPILKEGRIEGLLKEKQ